MAPTGVRVGLYNTILSVLTALTIVLGMRMMGAMLISSLVIFPALTAMRLFKSFRGVVVCAAVTSVLCFCAGLTVSFALNDQHDLEGEDPSEQKSQSQQSNDYNNFDSYNSPFRYFFGW